MAEDKKNPHCIHVCGHIEAMMEDAADKKFEEKMKARKPIPCSTAEDSNQLHELYKDKVKRTEPSEEKAQMMKDLMDAIEHAQLVHSMTLLRVKQEETGLKRHPSTLSHMNHDDSDSEPEVEENVHKPETPDCTDPSNANPATDEVKTVDDTDVSGEGDISIVVTDGCNDQTDQ